MKTYSVEQITQDGYRLLEQAGLIWKMGESTFFTDTGNQLIHSGIEAANTTIRSSGSNLEDLKKEEYAAIVYECAANIAGLTEEAQVLMAQSLAHVVRNLPGLNSPL